MTSTASPTPSVFDDHAAGYDSVAKSALGVALRDRVHRVLHPLIAPGDAVADLGCGTGIDSEWLGPQVATVVGIDSSDEMVGRARQRCQHLDNVSFTVGDLAACSPAEPVDLVLSNFGAVNCVGDLSPFGQHLLSMLKPKGYAVLVSMPRVCPIELAVGIATRNRALIGRRSERARSADSAYTGLRVRYASARTLANAFPDNLRLTHAEALGVTLPPFEQRGWVEERPRLLAALGAADSRLARVGAAVGVGDHHIAVFQRTS